MSTPWRWAKAGARGLWRFLVGDTPEFAAVVAALVVYALLLHRVHPAVVYGLPALVVTVMAGSVLRHRAVIRRRQRTPGALRSGTRGAEGGPSGAGVREVPARPL